MNREDLAEAPTTELTCDEIITEFVAGRPSKEEMPSTEVRERAFAACPQTPKKIHDPLEESVMGDVLMIASAFPNPAERVLVGMGLAGLLHGWLRLGFALGRAWERNGGAHPRLEEAGDER